VISELCCFSSLLAPHSWLLALDWSIFGQPAFDGSGNYFTFLLVGLGWTVLLSFSAFALALIVGFLVGVLRTVPSGTLRAIAFGYTELFRNVPLLVQLFCWYFVFPELVPLVGPWVKEAVSPLGQQIAASCLCLGLFTSARVAEQVRAGLEPLLSRQRLAGLALGLPLRDVYGLVLLPITYRTLVPTLTSEFVNTVKNSAVASTIGMVELARQSQQLGEFTAHWYESFIAVTLLYALLNGAIILFSRWLERRWRIIGTIGK
jgi:glutamate/aspartate transport system permease protein